MHGSYQYDKSLGFIIHYTEQYFFIFFETMQNFFICLFYDDVHLMIDLLQNFTLVKNGYSHKTYIQSIHDL